MSDDDALVEAVARAIALEAVAESDEWQTWVGEARAAIAAVRDYDAKNPADPIWAAHERGHREGWDLAIAYTNEPKQAED